MVTPDYKTFLKFSKRGNLIPVYKEFLYDVETPVGIFLKLSRYSKQVFLLESVEGGEHLGRYSIIGLAPYMIVESVKNRMKVWGRKGKVKMFDTRDPLEELGKIMQGYIPVGDDELPRFYGGAVGYLGYDMISFFEKVPCTNKDSLGLPTMYFMFAGVYVIFDHVQHKVRLLTNVEVSEDPKKDYEKAVGVLNLWEKRMRTRSNIPFLSIGVPKKLKAKSNFSKEGFETIVRRAKSYIRAGDIIQVVLSQRFSVKITTEPFNIYRALRSINPSPYMFYIKDEGRFHLVGSSPELLIRCEGKNVETRPIAGTRPRGRDENEDKKLEMELLQDPKERAEHIMLVDLGRNDLGRVCRKGTVRVTDFMEIERYSHVMHIVSNVVGELDKGKGPFDVLRSTFPAGTVAGAPKIRAMEIIDELENIDRGPYAGAVGYFGYNGNMDTAITIRTIIVKGDMAYIQAGAGIVADSVPEGEYYETVNKAKGMIKAIELAESAK